MTDRDPDIIITTVDGLLSALENQAAAQPPAPPAWMSPEQVAVADEGTRKATRDMINAGRLASRNDILRFFTTVMPTEYMLGLLQHGKARATEWLDGMRYVNDICLHEGGWELTTDVEWQKLRDYVTSHVEA